MKLFTLALSLVLFLFATDSALALVHRNSRENRKPQPKEINAGDATIEKVGSLSISVKNGTKTRTYGIDEHTKILVSHKQSGAGALKKGMLVTVHASSLNPSVATSIEVDDPSVAQPPKPKQPAPRQQPTHRRR